MPEVNNNNHSGSDADAIVFFEDTDTWGDVTSADVLVLSEEACNDIGEGSNPSDFLGSEHVIERLSVSFLLEFYWNHNNASSQTTTTTTDK